MSFSNFCLVFIVLYTVYSAKHFKVNSHKLNVYEMQLHYKGKNIYQVDYPALFTCYSIYIWSLTHFYWDIKSSCYHCCIQTCLYTHEHTYVTRIHVHTQTHCHHPGAINKTTPSKISSQGSISFLPPFVKILGVYSLQPPPHLP